MADPERQPPSEGQRLRKELEETRDEHAKTRGLLQKEISRREFLIKSALAGGGVVGVAVGGGLGYLLGLDRKGGELNIHLTRDRLARLEKGALTFVHRPNGETVEAMRGANVPISPFPLPDEQARIEQAVSPHEWMAVDPLKLLLGRGGEDFAALARLVTSQSTSQQKKLGSDIEVVSGEVIDWVGLDHAYQLRTGGKDLIAEGIKIMTRTKVGDNIVAIGRDVSGGPLVSSVVDVSAPLPANFFAAGIVVPKPPASS